MSDVIEIEEIEVGRCTITTNLRFIGEVIGGGTGGPGKVSEITGWTGRRSVYWDRDNRSGSKRSGNCVWQLEADRLYQIDNVAVSSRNTDTFYVSTDRGQPVELSREEFDAERARRWPLEREEAIAAAERRRVEEEARMQREAEIAEQRRIEREALKELNDEAAAEIEKNGQSVEDGLPELSGTPRQIAYALNIRKAYAEKYPGDAALKRGTTAKYWIENHKSVLYR